MLTWIKRLVAAPVFEDEEKTRIALLLNNMLWAMGVLTGLGGLGMIAIDARGFFANWVSPAVISAAIALVVVLSLLMRRGYLHFASILFSLGLMVIVAFASYSYGGIRNPTTAGLFLCIIMAGLLLSGWGAVAFTALSVLVIIAFWYAEQVGRLPPYSESFSLFPPIAYSVIFIIGGMLLRYAIDSMTEALERARRNERAQIEANHALQELRASLEQQVAERTHALQRRTAQLQAAAEIEQAISAILDIERLTQQVVGLVRQKFELHYVGLFLVNETGDQATWQSGDGSVAESLRGQRVSLKDASEATSLISQSIAAAQARVVTQVSSVVPGAQSEAVLPLRSRGRAVGALVVYSGQPDTFDRDTIAILDTVADQVAVTLDNARLFAQSQAALEAAQRAYGEFSQQAWVNLLQARPKLGLRKDKSGVSPAGDARTPQVETALRTGHIAPDQEDETALAAPIKVRDQVIGAIGARKPDEAGKWTPEETALLQTIADQLGIALESARLYQDTQRRAAQERLVGEITARMRESLDMETVLKTAAEQIRQSFGMDKVVVRLVSDHTG